MQAQEDRIQIRIYYSDERDPRIRIHNYHKVLDLELEVLSRIANPSLFMPNPDSVPHQSDANLRLRSLVYRPYRAVLRIRCLFNPWIREPGSGMGKKNIPESYFRELRNDF
jgi:hypothetical protein